MVRSIYEALARGDREAFDALARDHLARQFTFESLLTGLTYQGAEGLRELVDDIQDTVDYVPEVEEAVDLGEHVLCVLRTSGRGSQSGVPVTQQIAGVWTFKEDRIVWGKSFASRAEALEAVGLREYPILVSAHHLLAEGRPDKELWGRLLPRREDQQRITERLGRQLERLGQRVTLEPVAEAAR